MSFVYDRKKTATRTHAATVELRISYDRKAKYMSTGVRLLPKEWHRGMVTNRPDAAELNKSLEKLRTDVMKVVNEMMEEGHVSIGEIPDRLRLMHGRGMTFLDFCRGRMEIRKYGRAKDSQERYDRFMRFFTAWGKIKYFQDVTDRNVMLMDEVLKEKGMKPYSKWNNYHRFLNSFILDAVAAGMLKRNPYKWLNIEKDKNSGGLQKFLTLKELHAIERVRLQTKSLEQVRDVFVFQTYTCLAYTDLASFDYSKAVRTRDGRMMYTGRRGKTKQEFSFLILKPAMRILEKYGGRLPVISNVKYNEYLKVVAQAAGVEKPVTSHWARHTGATILLNEGVDMETVAKILGHSSTKITRSVYAKLLDSTIADKMRRVEDKLE